MLGIYLIRIIRRQTLVDDINLSCWDLKETLYCVLFDLGPPRCDERIRVLPNGFLGLVHYPMQSLRRVPTSVKFLNILPSCRWSKVLNQNAIWMLWISKRVRKSSGNPYGLRITTLIQRSR